MNIMKLSELKDYEKFFSDSGILWQKLPLITNNKTQEMTYKGKYKCKRLDTNEIFYLTDKVLIRRYVL